MQEISILSFLTYFILMTLGAYWHYRKLCRVGRHMGGLWDYLVADYPARSASVGVALLGTAWASSTSGAADLINPELLWSMLTAGKLQVASVSSAISAIVLGAGFDGMLNKGGNE